MTDNPAPKSFIHEIVEADLASGIFEGRVHTRFPPEPNGYLHIGHAKSICLNFGLAKQYGGKTNLRFDDTNPTKEEQEYIDAIKEDVRWLGFEWDAELYASDYFQQLYDWALVLIGKGLAYVDDLTQDQIREYRGSLTQPGRNSPHRDRSIEENLNLFERMKAGEFDEGAKVLRARIDMASPIINLRDPVMYRILKASHPRTGDAWCIYPTYDWAHGQSDSIERITHSICTLEFENHRPLYEWFLQSLEVYAPKQIEFARLNLSHTVMSKRKLLRLVNEGHVSGWDDPRMPTLSGLRRRGVRPEALRAFADRIGVAKANSTIDYSLFEHIVRDDLENIAPRAMAVLNPLKVIIENFPEDKTEWFDVDFYRHDETREETRRLPLTREVYIEREDFEESPPPKYHRLTPGQEVRLMHACLTTCTGIDKDIAGNITAIRCTYDPDSLGGNAADGRKVKGSIHWVSVDYAVDAEIRLYNSLLTSEAGETDGEDEDDLIASLNPDSLTVLTAKLEPTLSQAAPASRYQFMRNGYFFADPQDSVVGKPVFNRVVGLKDSWAKQHK
ncbi:MAG: glutamine--tRNA ligase/YqeY domain fusion protein [Anaerolineae bacterium]|nr:MAG: glutamine--tRNA ligase/YqeY domain fusion protein [Anaerolineae bacterium]